MPEFSFAAPILPGMTEQWKKAVEEIKTTRLDDYRDSRQRLGIRREQVTLQQTPAGDLAIIHMEADEPDTVVPRMFDADGGFDRWFAENILKAVHGLSPDDPPPAVPNEVVLDELVVEADAEDMLSEGGSRTEFDGAPTESELEREAPFRTAAGMKNDDGGTHYAGSRSQGDPAGWPGGEVQRGGRGGSSQDTPAQKTAEQRRRTPSGGQERERHERERTSMSQDKERFTDMSEEDIKKEGQKAQKEHDAALPTGGTKKLDEKVKEASQGERTRNESGRISGNVQSNQTANQGPVTGGQQWQSSGRNEGDKKEERGRRSEGTR